MTMFRFFIATIFAFVFLSATAFISRAEMPAKDIKIIAFLADNRKFIDDWHHLPFDATPRIKSYRNVNVGTTYTLGLAAFVPAAQSGKKHLTFGIKMMAPNGEVLISEPSYANIQTNIPSKGGYALADPALTVDFSEQDTKGVYHFYIQMTDNDAKSQIYEDFQFTLK